MIQVEPDHNLVEPDDACPACGERRADYLTWRDDEQVECTICGKVYTPRA